MDNPHLSLLYLLPVAKIPAVLPSLQLLFLEVWGLFSCLCTVIIFPTCCFHFVSMLFCVTRKKSTFLVASKTGNIHMGIWTHWFFFLFKEKGTFLDNALTAWLANSDISNFSTSRSNSELPNIGYFVFLFEETYKTRCLIHKRWVNLPWIFDIHDPYSYR